MRKLYQTILAATSVVLLGTGCTPNNSLYLRNQVNDNQARTAQIILNEGVKDITLARSISGDKIRSKGQRTVLRFPGYIGGVIEGTLGKGVNGVADATDCLYIVTALGEHFADCGLDNANRRRTDYFDPVGGPRIIGSEANARIENLSTRFREAYHNYILEKAQQKQE